MQFEIARLERVRRTIAPTVRIRDGQITGSRNKPDGKGGWIKEAIYASAPFAADIWRLQRGYENWVRNGSKTQLDRQVVAFDQQPPATPTGGYDIYLLPICTAELGGYVDLVLDDAVSSEALAAFCTEMQTWDEYHSVQPLMIPEIEIVGTEETELGIMPVFSILQWAPRPKAWPAPLLKSTTKQPEPQSEWSEQEQELIRLLHERRNQQQQAG